MTPIYLQISNQIKYLIQSADLKTGEALPPRKALANQLNVNINTINHAYQVLEAEGYIKSRKGSGSYVEKGVVEEKELSRMRKVSEIIGHSLEKCLSIGSTYDEFLNLTPLIVKEKKERGEIRGALIECHETWLLPAAKKLENSLGIKIDPILISDFRTKREHINKILSAYELIITAHSHYQEVRKLLKDKEKKIHLIALYPSFDMINTLNSLRIKKAAVGYLEPEIVKRVEHAIRAMGLQIELEPIGNKHAYDIEKQLGNHQVVMVPQTHKEEVEKAIPSFKGEIVGIDGLIGGDGIEHLKEIVSKMRKM